MGSLPVLPEKMLRLKGIQETLSQVGQLEASFCQNTLPGLRQFNLAPRRTVMPENNLPKVIPPIHKLRTDFQMQDGSEA